MSQFRLFPSLEEETVEEVPVSELEAIDDANQDREEETFSDNLTAAVEALNTSYTTITKISHALESCDRNDVTVARLAVIGINAARRNIGARETRIAQEASALSLHAVAVESVGEFIRKIYGHIRDIVRRIINHIKTVFTRFMVANSEIIISFDRMAFNKIIDAHPDGKDIVIPKYQAIEPDLYNSVITAMHTIEGTRPNVEDIIKELTRYSDELKKLLEKATSMSTEALTSSLEKNSERFNGTIIRAVGFIYKDKLIKRIMDTNVGEVSDVRELKIEPKTLEPSDLSITPTSAYFDKLVIAGSRLGGLINNLNEKIVVKIGSLEKDLTPPKTEDGAVDTDSVSLEHTLRSEGSLVRLASGISLVLPLVMICFKYPFKNIDSIYAELLRLSKQGKNDEYPEAPPAQIKDITPEE